MPRYILEYNQSNKNIFKLPYLSYAYIFFLKFGISSNRFLPGAVNWTNKVQR